MQKMAISTSGMCSDSDERFLRRRHATDGGAVAVAARAVAGAHALDEGYSLHGLAVGRPLYSAFRRPRGAEHPLELDRRDHVGVPPVAVLAPERRLQLLGAGGEDDGADPEHFGFRPHVVEDRARCADRFAKPAVRAQPAVEAAPRLGDGVFLRIAQVDLAHVPRALVGPATGAWDVEAGVVSRGRDSARAFRQAVPELSPPLSCAPR